MLQYYKRDYVGSMEKFCLIGRPYAGIIDLSHERSVFDMSKKEKKKHPQNIIIVAVAVLGLALIIGNLGDDDTPDASVVSSAPVLSEQSKTEKIEPAEPEEEPEKESITLDWQIPGDYGKTITLNEGTPDEYSYIVFYLPAGTYEILNFDSSKACQITVYQDGTTVNENGYEEPISSDIDPVVLMSEEKTELTIKEGQYIKLSDGTMFVSVERK